MSLPSFDRKCSGLTRWNWTSKCWYPLGQRKFLLKKHQSFSIIGIYKSYLCIESNDRCNSNRFKRVFHSSISGENFCELITIRGDALKISYVKTRQELETFLVCSSFWPFRSGAFSYSLVVLLTAVLLWNEKNWIRKFSVIGFLRMLW